MFSFGRRGPDDGAKSRQEASDGESDASSDSGHFGDDPETPSRGNKPSPLPAEVSRWSVRLLGSFHPFVIPLQPPVPFDPDEETADEDSDTTSDKSSDSGHASDDFDPVPESESILRTLDPVPCGGPGN